MIICEIIVHCWSQYKIETVCTNVHYVYLSALLKEIVSFIHDLSYVIIVIGDTRWRSWLRHCATSQKVAGSISDGVI